MSMFDDLNEDDLLNEEESLENFNEEDNEEKKDDKKENKKDDDKKEDKKDDDKKDDKKENKDDKDDDKDDDDKDDDKDDDDDDDDIEDLKDEEVIDSFILNEAAEEDLIQLENAQGVNFKNEKKIKWVTKEQKLKRLTYKISILMAKKNNDSDYKKWAKGRAIVVAARKKIMLKYKARALSRARKVIAAYRAGKFAGLLQDKKDIAQPKGIQKT